MIDFSKIEKHVEELVLNLEELNRDVKKYKCILEKTYIKNKELVKENEELKELLNKSIT